MTGLKAPTNGTAHVNGKGKRTQNNYVTLGLSQGNTNIIFHGKAVNGAIKYSKQQQPPTKQTNKQTKTLPTHAFRVDPLVVRQTLRHDGEDADVNPCQPFGRKRKLET